MAQHIEVELENGNKLHFKTNPRHGTWSVNYDKGPLPAELSGEWTSYQHLYDKTMAYLTKRQNKTGVKSAA